MNLKIQKLADEIEKMKRKITEYQSRLRDMERQKTELENADIIAMVRGVDMPPEQLAEFARMFMETHSGVLPELPKQAVNAAESGVTEE